MKNLFLSIFLLVLFSLTASAQFPINVAAYKTPSGGSTVFKWDDFTTGATGNLTSHTPTGTNAGTAWVSDGGSVFTNPTADNAYENNNGSGNRYRMNDDLGSANMTVEGDFTATGAANTFLGIRVRSTAGGIASLEWAYDFAQGGWDGIGPLVTEAWPGGTVNIKVVCNGTSVSGYVNGVLKATGTNSGTGQYAGFLLGNFGGGATQTMTIDNYKSSSP